ncbi:hypothetical protein [Phenylobacterium sp.]|uniref:hypothetical protein n=1 Tax=Phenylobacterium sp. TaxID=1871053 RepID=UPI002734135A|nr:hypothetical protein [Phenylobacterium sp.]MDP3855925.1 hypothetical protein [Phenylobacterium sp.]
MRFVLPLTFAVLMAGAAFAAAPTPEAPNTVSGVTVTGGTASDAAPAAIDDPVICRKAPETGSRVRALKECRKKSEWVAKAKSRGRGVESVRMGDCGGGGAACDLTPRPPGN